MAKKALNIGILALQGDVSEHFNATVAAAKKLKLACNIIFVRSKTDLANLDGIIIPGGESTVLHKLLVKFDMFEGIKKIPAIFGTCAGTILLAKEIKNKAPGQETLGLMSIVANRNAYGQQTESFEDTIDTEIGKMNAVFIRAPQISKTGSSVKILANYKNQTVACEESVGGTYYLASCFHPELTTTKFHEYFLSKCK